MNERWHPKYDPASFLKLVDLDKLLQKNEAFAKNHVNQMKKVCFKCRTLQGEGLLLNDKSFLCKSCFEEVSRIQYPYVYEQRRREFISGLDAWEKARQELINTSLIGRLQQACGLLTGVGLALTLWKIEFLFIIGSCFAFWLLFGKMLEQKLKNWEAKYRKPSEPLLRHFHDPEAMLERQDYVILHIFNHWPGYPPFWEYLRRVVLNRDDHRCQVTGCPSRLELHIHHIKAVSNGGAHTPTNLIALCEFHHALEPEIGHLRVWGRISNQFFSLVREHTRSSKTDERTHRVRTHLRRRTLISIDDLYELTKIYGFCCPRCGDSRLKFILNTRVNLIDVECKKCGDKYQGTQQLAEETGPQLAEVLKVTRNLGSWPVRWKALSDRKQRLWTKPVQGKKRNASHPMTEFPLCPKCGASMRRIKPRLGYTWNEFWGCINYRVTGCKGKRSTDVKQ